MQVELFVIEQCECLYFSNHLYSRHGTCSDCCGNHLKGEGWEDGSVGRRAFALKKWRSGAGTQGPAYWHRHQSLSSFWDHSDTFPGDFGPCRWRHFCVQWSSAVAFWSLLEPLLGLLSGRGKERSFVSWWCWPVWGLVRAGIWSTFSCVLTTCLPACSLGTLRWGAASWARVSVCLSSCSRLSNLVICLILKRGEKDEGQIFSLPAQWPNFSVTLSLSGFERTSFLQRCPGRFCGEEVWLWRVPGDSVTCLLLCLSVYVLACLSIHLICPSVCLLYLSIHPSIHNTLSLLSVCTCLLGALLLLGLCFPGWSGESSLLIWEQTKGRPGLSGAILLRERAACPPWAEGVNPLIRALLPTSVAVTPCLKTVVCSQPPWCVVAERVSVDQPGLRFADPSALLTPFPGPQDQSKAQLLTWVYTVGFKLHFHVDSVELAPARFSPASTCTTQTI